MVISADPQIDEYQTALARAYMESGEFSSATGLLEKLMEGSPESKEAQELFREARSRL